MVLPFWRPIPPKADIDTVLDHPNPACAVWCQHHHHKCWRTLVSAGPSAHVTEDPPCVFATNSHPARHACLHRAQDWNIASISLLESMALFSHGFVLPVFPSPNLQPRCLQICDLMNLLFWLNKATHFQQDMRAQLVHLQASGIHSSANSFSPLEGRDKKLALLPCWDLRPQGQAPVSSAGDIQPPQGGESSLLLSTAPCVLPTPSPRDAFKPYHTLRAHSLLLTLLSPLLPSSIPSLSLPRYNTQFKPLLRLFNLSLDHLWLT